MDRLAHTLELLDGPLEPDTLAGNLRDLARINRWLGGASLSRHALERLSWSGGPRLDLLDVGTGGADIPLRLLESWSGSTGLTVVAVDSRPEVIDAARRVHPGIDRTTGLRLEVADGAALPFSDGQFDVVHASMVLHHLEPGEAVAMLRELRRVARRAIVINDLQRARIHWLGAWLMGHLLTRNAYTRNDAPLSVRRAYTAREMSRLLVEAGLRPRSIERGFLGHRWAILAEVPDAAGGAAGVGGATVGVGGATASAAPPPGAAS